MNLKLDSPEPKRIRMFQKKMKTLIDEIENCSREPEKREFVCLILLYAGLDIMASLERKGPNTTRDDFTAWVGRYLLKVQSLPCTAIDLYAARCGILHTLSTKSHLSLEGKAQELLYAHNKRNVDELKGLVEHLKDKRPELFKEHSYVVVCLHDIIDAFRKGTDKYFQELNTDPKRQGVAEKHIKSTITYIPAAS